MPLEQLIGVVYRSGVIERHSEIYDRCASLLKILEKSRVAVSSCVVSRQRAWSQGRTFGCEHGVLCHVSDNMRLRSYAYLR